MKEANEGRKKERKDGRTDGRKDEKKARYEGQYIEGKGEESPPPFLSLYIHPNYAPSKQEQVWSSVGLALKLKGGEKRCVTTKERRLRNTYTHTYISTHTYVHTLNTHTYVIYRLYIYIYIYIYIYTIYIYTRVYI